MAWAANKLGQKAVVHMPKGSSQARFDNIAREGAAVTIEDVNEPYLMQIGFLSRTPRGRCVTKAAYDHLGLPYGGDTASGVQLDVFSDSN